MGEQRIANVTADKPRLCPHGAVWLVGSQVCMCKQQGEYCTAWPDITPHYGGFDGYCPNCRMKVATK